MTSAAALDWVKPMLAEKFFGSNSVRLSTSLGASTLALLAARILAPGKEAAKDVRQQGRANVVEDRSKGRTGATATKVAVNQAFINNFTRLLKIAMPDVYGKQGGYLALLSVFLLLRTGLSLKISAFTGNIAKRMVETEAKPLALAVLELALWSVPASFVNSALKYLTALLEIEFRRNLTRYFHKRYLTHQNFFRCVGAVDSVEQRITQDVQKFSNGAASLYTTLFKPIIDIILFGRQVAIHGGWKGPTMVMVWYSIVTFVIRALAPNFALLTTIQQQKEGQLRSEHTKLIEFAEEVTLAQGESATLGILNRLFGKSQAHYLYTSYLKAGNNVLDGMLVKYGSVMVGYAACGLSIFSPEASKMSSSELTGLYIHTSQLLVNLARSIGQLIMTYRTVASLAGFTHRVSELEDGLATVEKKIKEQQREKAQKELAGTGGVVVTGSLGISFTDVPIVTPTNAVLVEKLSFKVEPGMNLLIVGPNGCGKSSTFRLLGELWPLHGGRIEKPGFEHLYYVPQRPYMSCGTLRDQVIYPTETKDLKVGEDKLYQCLEMASLEGLLNQPGVSWGARQNWAGEALSQGQKQKLAMARLFFHRPRFAILDECTSAIDLDVEQKLYQHCRELGISLITIAHRRSLWRYHDWVLRFDGNGGYMFSPLEFGAKDEMILAAVQTSSDPSVLGRRIVIQLTAATEEEEDAGIVKADPHPLNASPSTQPTKTESSATSLSTNVAEPQEEQQQPRNAELTQISESSALAQGPPHADGTPSPGLPSPLPPSVIGETEIERVQVENEDREKTFAERSAAVESGAIPVPDTPSLVPASPGLPGEDVAGAADRSGTPRSPPRRGKGNRRRNQ